MLSLLTEESFLLYSEAYSNNRSGDGGLHCEDSRVVCILASVSRLFSICLEQDSALEENSATGFVSAIFAKML